MILAAASCCSVFGGTREENPRFPVRARQISKGVGGDAKPIFLQMSKNCMKLKIIWYDLGFTKSL